MTNRKAIQPDGFATPAAPYSLGIRSGNMLFISGITSLDSSGQTMGSTIEEQTRNVLETINKILAEEGAGLAAIVKTTVYLPDFAHYAGMNAVYATYFPDTPPARATVGATLAKKEWLVEIDAVAVI